MSAVLWVLGVVGYLAVGIGFARLRAWQVFRRKRIFNTADLQAEMLALLFLWPSVVPLTALVMVLRLALFPRRLR
jgi:hypothetical protein